MEWEIEYTDEFGAWWNRLTEDEQVDVDATVRVPRQRGPALRRPHSGVIASSRHPNMKELIIQHAGRPYRVLYAFDPRRSAILLIGGDKTGPYQKTTGGMKNQFPLPIVSTTNIWPL